MTGESGKPGRNCPRCPRLKAFRDQWRRQEPTWFNAPVPSFGPLTARLLIIGLAPGLQGANRTGRPFTGDYAGALLYDTMARYGFARGKYEAHPEDGLEQNKPTGAEIATCRAFLKPTIAEMPKLRAVVTLGRIAHDSVLAAFDQRPKAAAFGHGASHTIGKLQLFCSYHCSRLNTNTGVLTPEMFRKVFVEVRRYLDA